MHPERVHNDDAGGLAGAYTDVTRRTLLRAGLLAGGALALGPAFYRDAFAAAATGVRVGTGPYGVPSVDTPLGIKLPLGFTAREIARGGQNVASTSYRWHTDTDGQAVFPAVDGGWILVSNSETTAAKGGGCSAIRFTPDGQIVDAYRALSGTQQNCAGGATPWGTYLSGEEYTGGHLWEVDPTARRGTKRKIMGTFTHESVCVDPVGERLYMTEDVPDGCLYRFTPDAYPTLAAGTLEAAVVDATTGAVRWVRVNPNPFLDTTRAQGHRQGAKRFNGGEGTWWDGGVVYFTTKGDTRVWAYDCVAGRLEVLYDAATIGPDSPLRGVDNICVSRSGDLYVCEDGDDLDLCLITPDQEVSRFCTFDRNIHAATSELVGVTFDPSGTRLYVGSQRSFGGGALYEISGPFRQPPALTSPPSFEQAFEADQVEVAAGSLALVRAKTRYGRSNLAKRGLAVRISLREPCAVRAQLITGLGTVADHRFPTAVTGLTAARLVVAGTATGSHQLVVDITPTAGGATETVRIPVTVTA